MTPRHFIAGPGRHHIHDVYVSEFSVSGNLAASCTVSPPRDSAEVSDCLTIWASGPAGTIAPSLHAVLTNYQVLQKDGCFVCSLGKGDLYWQFESNFDSYKPTLYIHGTMECSEHGSHDIQVSHGQHNPCETDYVPATLMSADPADPAQTVMLLYPEGGDGENLIDCAFGIDYGEGCPFDGKRPLVCWTGASAIKVGWHEVSRALSEFKETDRKTLEESSQALSTSMCVTAFEDLIESKLRGVKVWVPGPLREDFVPGTHE